MPGAHSPDGQSRHAKELVRAAYGPTLRGASESGTSTCSPGRQGMALTGIPMSTTPLPRRFPQAPAHPERLCWGCDQLCAHDQLRCGNDTVRTPHPFELWGPQWVDGLAPEPSAAEQDHEHPLPLPR